MLSTWKSEEVSQDCFVFDVVKFKKLIFKKLRVSSTIASFLILSSSKIEVVSQNCFVFECKR